MIFEFLLLVVDVVECVKNLHGGGDEEETAS